jgi:hypothetical protein
LGVLSPASRSGVFCTQAVTMDIGAVVGSAGDWRQLVRPSESPGTTASDERSAGPASRVPRAADANAGDAVKPRPCGTCAERRYKDVSDDPAVSFQAPTSIAPEQAAAAVDAHEQEHVVNNAARAERSGQTARSTVSIHFATCPECGRSYVSGGTTTTTYSKKASANSEPAARGLVIDTTA